MWFSRNKMTPPPPPPKPPKVAADPQTGEEIYFNERTVDGLVKLKFKIDKTKISNEALKLFTEIIRVHSIELMNRCAEQAKKEGAEVVSNEHLEKILPQFLLDFA